MLCYVLRRGVCLSRTDIGLQCLYRFGVSGEFGVCGSTGVHQFTGSQALWLIRAPELRDGACEEQQHVLGRHVGRSRGRCLAWVWGRGVGVWLTVFLGHVFVAS